METLCCFQQHSSQYEGSTDSTVNNILGNTARGTFLTVMLCNQDLCQDKAHQSGKMGVGKSLCVLERTCFPLTDPYAQATPTTTLSNISHRGLIFLQTPPALRNSVSHSRADQVNMWMEEIVLERTWPLASLAAEPPWALHKNPLYLGSKRLGNTINLINLNPRQASLSNVIYLFRSKNTDSCEISLKLKISILLAVTFQYKSKFTLYSVL